MQKFEVNAVHLYDAIDDPPLGLLLVMMPRAADIEELEELASSGRGKTIVLVNPQWDPWDPPADSRAFLSNFKVAYSYFPLQVQMLVVRQEAAVLKCALDGSPGPQRRSPITDRVHFTTHCPFLLFVLRSLQKRQHISLRRHEALVRMCRGCLLSPADSIKSSAMQTPRPGEHS